MIAARQAILARAIDAVRINRCWRGVAPHASYVVPAKQAWFKRRKRGAEVAVLAGNVFLIASNSRIRMFESTTQWLRWETASFRLLHGDSFDCGALDRRTFWSLELPGTPLRALAMRSQLSSHAVSAAGREFARAHALACPIRTCAWSHGDPHLGNVLYDEAADRARLIDFETRHETHLSARERQADDLLTFVLELTAKSNVEAASAFLRAYGKADVLAALRDRLSTPPSGLERVLWQTRTDHASVKQIDAWTRQLRHASERARQL